MKVKTSELTRAALDWTVAIAMELKPYYDYKPLGLGRRKGVWVGTEYRMRKFSPSTYWNTGGPIIEREGITISKTAHGFWEAYKRPSNEQECYQTGDAPLVEAMRCFVASRLGDEVEIPEELLK